MGKLRFGALVMTQDDKTDAGLMKRVTAGDKGAMQTVYLDHAADLTRFITARLGDPAEAADLVHETMMDVWRDAHRFEGRGSLRSWIFRIARNKTVDRVRKARRNVLTDEDPDVEDERPGPAALLAAAQNAERLATCIAHLSDRHKAVIHLAFFEDLTYEEIAEIEDCPVGTVKTRIFHAKKLLMYCLCQDGGDGTP